MAAVSVVHGVGLIQERVVILQERLLGLLVEVQLRLDIVISYDHFDPISRALDKYKGEIKFLLIYFPKDKDKRNFRMWSTNLTREYCSRRAAIETATYKQLNRGPAVSSELVYQSQSRSAVVNSRLVALRPSLSPRLGFSCQPWV